MWFTRLFTCEVPITHVKWASHPCEMEINISDFCNDILFSDIFKVPVTTLQSYLETFTSTLSSLLDKHAPFKNISCSSKTQKPFITPDIRSEKAKRSKLETIYRRSRRPSDFQKFQKAIKLWFINLYLTLDVRITAHSFWHAKIIHASSGLL